LELIPAVKPVAEYVLAKQLGDLVYVSGQGPIKGGKPVYVGQVGGAVTAEERYDAAQICILNELAAVKEAEMIVCVTPDLIGRE
jgi:enamine deaminase RidA (YjgF/YER057c/UK114 family)